MMNGDTGVASRITFWRKSSGFPSLSTGRACMELGGKGVFLCAKTQDWAPASLLTLTQAVSAWSPSFWPQVNKILEEIALLQEAAQKFKIQPEEQFRAWFWAIERLSENTR